MSAFFDILPPPQSLETLDEWGALDSLPASLDSELWQNAGLYGLRIAESAHASGRSAVPGGSGPQAAVPCAVWSSSTCVRKAAPAAGSA